MGRFHRHEDGTAHAHDHAHDGHEHGHERHAKGHGQGDRGDHSAYQTGTERVTVLERIFEENDRAAEANRARLHAHGVACVNLMSSPGSGKTRLLQATLERLRDEFRIGVVEGDIETSIDAERLAGLGAQVSLLNTANGFGGECHLDAPMVARGLDGLELDQLDLILVENVGNLVCPAEFDVGADVRVMVSSIAEGEDKPLKYPVMFRSVDLVVINKIDLLPHLEFDLDLLERNIQAANPGVDVIALSARTGEGLDQWLRWLRERLAAGGRLATQEA